MTTLFAPAKINLFLAVDGPDARGWHPLRTIFQTISLYDELEVTNGRDEDAVTYDRSDIGPDDTVTRALRFLRDAGADFAPLRVRVKKEIPSEAGLGGGSSDAAALLRHLAEIGAVTEKAARAAARRTGADVPFLLNGGLARAEGYGEKLTPLPPVPERWLVVARPEIGCPTPEMFARLDRSGPRPFREFPSEDILYNDFERVAPGPCHALLKALREAGADDAGLTGSGSAVFGRFADELAAKRASENVTAPFVKVARTVTG